MHLKKWPCFFNLSMLTCCSLSPPYGITNFCQHCYRWWLFAWRHLAEALTWTNFESLSVGPSGTRNETSLKIQLLLLGKCFWKCRHNDGHVYSVAFMFELMIAASLVVGHQWTKFQVCYAGFVWLLRMMSLGYIFLGMNRWLSPRLQYLQCVSNGDIAVLC